MIKTIILVVFSQLMMFFINSSTLKQVTRSIGDDDLKPAVTAEPEITETVLTSQDDCLVNSIYNSCFISKLSERDRDGIRVGLGTLIVCYNS